MLCFSVTLTPQLAVLAYQVYLSVARQLPPMLRQWYLTLDRQTGSQVSAFTSKNVSPSLWQSEVESMQSPSTKIGNMEASCVLLDIHICTRKTARTLNMQYCCWPCSGYNLGSLPVLKVLFIYFNNYRIAKILVDKKFDELVKNRF